MPEEKTSAPIQALHQSFEQVLHQYQLHTDAQLTQMQTWLSAHFATWQEVFALKSEKIVALLPAIQETVANEASQLDIIKELVGGNDIRNLNLTLQQLKNTADQNQLLQQEKLSQLSQEIAQAVQQMKNRLENRLSEYSRTIVSILEMHNQRQIDSKETQTLLEQTAELINPNL
ncbi:MAG: hypothetical protein H7Y04_09520 [Verrucomicrobia bacterium]|nr:hypothetical protein [Cytophagales bacterium]